jgi:heat shock protein HtpX
MQTPTPTLQNTVTGTKLATQARTFILLAGLTGLLVVIGGLLGGIGGMVLFLGIGVAFNFAMYWFSDRLALRMSGAKPLDESDDPELFAMVASLARRAQLPMPRLYVIPQEQPNAFATGRNPKNAAIAVTAGIRRLMPAYQLEGVLAHEFAHIKNRDILVQSVAAMIAGAISGIAQLLTFSFLFGGGDDDDSPLGTIGAIAMIVLAPIAAMIIQLSISRQREYLADATGAQILGAPDPLADALESLERGAAAIPMEVNPSSEPLYIVSPLRGTGVAGLFATHPPIQERVRRLRALRV